MRRLLGGMLGLLLVGSALAEGPRAIRERVEGSMVVTGTIGITPEGAVLGYTLDHPEQLPPVVADMIGKNIPDWRFQPVLQDGTPAAAKAKMSLRVVARPIGDGRFQVGVRSAYFGDPAHGIKKDRSAPPRYPMQAIRGRVEATVYLALHLDRAGKVADAAAQQVNLRVVADDNEMKQWRDLFAKATLKAARDWEFTPAGPADHALYRDVLVPVSFRLGDASPPRETAYGQWETYVPGPREPMPWPDADRLLTGGDALPGDGVYGASSLSLLTPLDRS